MIMGLVLGLLYVYELYVWKDYEKIKLVNFELM